MTIQSLDKAVRSGTNSFEFIDVTSPTQRQSHAEVGLLTAMLGGGQVANFYNTDDKFVYDDMVSTIQLPTGKASDGYGNDLQKDKPRELMFRGGSYGFRWNVSPHDVKSKRKFGSNEKMTVEDHVVALSEKADKAWALFTELSYAQLLTTDTNYVAGGPAKVYEYHNTIEGSSRPAATFMDLDNTTDVWLAEQAQLDKLQEACEKNGVSYTTPVFICGSSYFDKRYALEVNEGIAREIRGPLDLASMAIPRDSFGVEGGIFRRRYFESERTGAVFIRSSESILSGTPLIPADKAYLVPVGTSEMFARAFAPKTDMRYVNTTALERYVGVEEHNERGITVQEEQNVLYLNRKPACIIALDEAAS